MGMDMVTDMDMGTDTDMSIPLIAAMVTIVNQNLIASQLAWDLVSDAVLRVLLYLHDVM